MVTVTGCRLPNMGHLSIIPPPPSPYILDAAIRRRRRRDSTIGWRGYGVPRAKPYPPLRLRSASSPHVPARLLLAVRVAEDLAGSSLHDAARDGKARVAHQVQVHLASSLASLIDAPREMIG